MTVGRNDPCPCGSGKKYKKCCLAKDQERQNQKFSVPPTPPPTPVRKGAEIPRPKLTPIRPVVKRELTPVEVRWAEFENLSTIEDRINLFHRTIDDGLMDEENAFGMVDLIERKTRKPADRPILQSLIETLRQRLPDVYAKSGNSFASWDLHAALDLGQEDRLLGLAEEVGSFAAEISETFEMDLQFICYKGRLDLAVRMIHTAWPHLRDETSIFQFYLNEYANKGIQLELRVWLDAHPDTIGDEPALLEQLCYYNPKLTSPQMTQRVRQFCAALTGRAEIFDKQSEYAWDPILASENQSDEEEIEEDELPEPQEEENADEDIFLETEEEEDLDEDNSDEDLWGDDEEDQLEMPHVAQRRLLTLLDTFQGEARRKEGIPWTRSLLATHGLNEYLIQRRFGDDESKGIPRPPEHPLVPDAATLEPYLAECMGILDVRLYRALAIYELLPAWMRFLREKGLLNEAQHRRWFNNLLPLRPQFAKMLHSSSMDASGLSAWDQRP